MKTALVRKQAGTGSVQRISVSLPEGIFRELDQMVAERGLENRSKAIAEMISRFVLERREASGDPVMAGMIALVYDECRGGLAQRLFELERKYRKEVISSLHVQLEEQSSHGSSCRAGSRPHSQGDYRQDPFVQGRALVQTDPYRYRHSPSAFGAGPEAGSICPSQPELKVDPRSMSQFLSAALYSEILPSGAMWSMRIPRRRLVRLTALDSGANLSALLYNATSRWIVSTFRTRSRRCTRQS